MNTLIATSQTTCKYCLKNKKSAQDYLQLGVRVQDPYCTVVYSVSLGTLVPVLWPLLEADVPEEGHD